MSMSLITILFEIILAMSLGVTVYIVRARKKKKELITLVRNLATKFSDNESERKTQLVAKLEEAGVASEKTLELSEQWVGLEKACVQAFMSSILKQESDGVSFFNEPFQEFSTLLLQVLNQAD